MRSRDRERARERGRGALLFVAVAACSSAPRAKAPPGPPPPPPPPTQCSDCCAKPLFAAEVDPASTLDFHPYNCTLRLEGWYAMEIALAGPRNVSWSLICQEQGTHERALAIRYSGEPVDDAPITDLADPYHTSGREGVTTVSFDVYGPHAPPHRRFEAGEVRFRRPPRALLEREDVGSRHVEVDLDLRFEGDLRLRAALRICPDYPHYGPVSDPVR